MTEAKALLFDICKMLSKSIHDINNSLFVIMGQMSILEHLVSKEETDPEKIKKTLEKMKRGGDQTNQKMTLLRDFYRVGLDDPNFASWTALKVCLEYLLEVQEDHKISFEVIEEPSFSLPPSEGFFILYHIAKATTQAENHVRIQEKDGAICFESEQFGSEAKINHIDTTDQKQFKLPL